jgi:hypothetical protein
MLCGSLGIGGILPPLFSGWRQDATNTEKVNCFSPDYSGDR